MLRIGVDANCWANRRGYGRYARELMGALLAQDANNDYTFYLDAPTAAVCPDLPPPTRQVVVPTGQAATQAAGAAGNRSLRDLWAMSEAVRRHGRATDIFFFPSVYTYFPLRIRAHVVVTIHDTIPERYPALVFPNRRARLFWALKVRLALAQARLVVTVSETARRSIQEQFHLPAARIRVVGNAPSPLFRPTATSDRTRAVLEAYGIPPDERFVIYAGGISPHKNLLTLLMAFAALCEQPAHAGVRLVLVGDYQQDVFFSDYRNLRRRVEELGLARRVIFTGYVPDEDLVHLYSAARLLVLPSLDEGFGLPVVEAMSCGTPVVVSTAGALPEVVGDAGLQCNPAMPAQFTAGMQALLENDALHHVQSLRARQRALAFSWDRSAATLLAIFEELGRPHVD